MKSRPPFEAEQAPCPQPEIESVTFGGVAAFARRRNTAGLRAGDAVIVQTRGAGQARALCMGAPKGGEIAVRFSRWGATVIVETGAILRRLAGGWA